MSYDTREMLSSWRSLASSRVSALKDYVNQKDLRTIVDRRALRPGEDGYVEGDSRKQSWRQWAGEKINGNTANTREHIFLFPGWATRRREGNLIQFDGSAEPKFDLEVFVSGFASSSRPPDQASRSQRAFLRLAKAFASLPNLPDANIVAASQHLPARGYARQYPLNPATPGSMDSVDELNLEELDRKFQQASLEAETRSECSSSTESAATSPIQLSRQGSPDFLSAQQSPDQSTDVRRLHANFHSRLRPFWSSSLSNRIVRLSLYTYPPNAQNMYNSLRDDPSKMPLVTEDVLTSNTGAFQTKIKVSWEKLCQHPGALQIAFGDPPDVEYDLHVLAEVVAPPIPASLRPEIREPTVPARSLINFPITQADVRVISDVDDTIKMSNVLGGARAVFQNVFVKHLEELCIPGMGDWYTAMWSRGVRFHYVSNMPFELLPVLQEFLQVSQLPPGSIKLKSYAGRSLFNGLLSAPAIRKREGVLDILRNFLTSQFILVGDTGEQDLELYADLARERPKQILGVFVREASGGTLPPLDDPTGEEVRRALETRKLRSLGITGSLFSEPESMGLDLPARPPIVAVSGSITPRRIAQSRSENDSNVTPTTSDNFKYGASLAVPPKPRLPPRASSTNGGHMSEDYFSQRRRPPPPPPRRTTKAMERSPSAPAPVSVPSTYFDSGFPVHDSPTAYSTSSAPSRPASPSATANASQLGELSQLLPGRILTPAQLQSMSPLQKKKYDLQLRIWRARLLVPSHITVRIFRQPEECVEYDKILNNALRRSSS